MRIITLAAFAALALPAAAQAQVSGGPFTLTTPGYTQDFNTLASSGATGSALPAGFRIVETGGTGGTTYGVNNGSSNTGNSYSYGTTGSVDRALGSLASGTVEQILFGGVFTNGLGAAITSLTFGYTGEQWRSGTSTAADRLTFQYRIGAADITGDGWTTVDSLSFAPVVLGANTALNGDLPANQRALTGTISGLNVANGSTFGFRWLDVDAVGSDNGLAVDNLSIAAVTAAAPGAVPEPSTWAFLILGFGTVGAALRRRPRAVASLA